MALATSKGSDQHAHTQSLDYPMINKLLTEHHLEFLSLKGSCTGSSESTLAWADPEGGGTGGLPPSPKDHKNIGFLAILVRIPAIRPAFNEVYPAFNSN